VLVDLSIVFLEVLNYEIEIKFCLETFILVQLLNIILELFVFLILTLIILFELLNLLGLFFLLFLFLCLQSIMFSETS